MQNKTFTNISRSYSRRLQSLNKMQHMFYFFFSYPTIILKGEIFSKHIKILSEKAIFIHRINKVINHL